jgi:O-acetyl-ADP-ribose deacetylase (regulator of RNase III)
VIQIDVFQRLTLVEADPLAVAADALVVEDDGWLTATRGLAAQIDGQHAELRAQRERALAEHEGALPLGSVVPCRVGGSQPPHVVLWAVTWCQAHDAAPRARATPLVVEAVTRTSLQDAAALGAEHVGLPALGTRTDQHVLPPVPKKLPRYVMGAAQLVGIRAALEAHPLLRVTVCLTQRDLAIWHTLLGQAEDNEA